MNINIHDEYYYKIIDNIINNDEFKKLANIEHHGITRIDHSIKVSYYSYLIAKKLNFDYISVARGGLLHDFFLNGDERNKLKKFTDTFTHPKLALYTAGRIFDINKIEKNIIISHMFPFYISIPKYKESILVNLVDKYIGFIELSREYKNKCQYEINYLYVFILLLLSR